MVRAFVRRPRPFRGVFTAALLSLLLSSCAFLTSDIFPSWLSFADANLDLRGLVRGFGAVDEPESLYVEYLQTVGGPAYIAVLYYEGTAWRLVFLDPEDMGYLASLKEPGFSPFLGAGSGGDIVCGTVSVAAATLTSQTPAPTSLPGGGRAYLVRAGAGANQYIVGSPNSSNVAWIQYDSAWVSSPPGTIGAGAAPYPSTTIYLQDADTDVPGTGANYLFRDTSSGGYGYLAYYAATASIETNPPLSSSATQVTGPFRMDDGRGWITSGGPVAYVRGDNGPDRLVRYKLGSVGTEQDSLPFDSDDMEILSFDPTGRYWFIYDRISGRLFKLRTWWK